MTAEEVAGEPFASRDTSSKPRAVIVSGDHEACSKRGEALADLFEIHTSDSARGARGILAATTFDLIVSDQLLPDALGVELLEATMDAQPGAVRVLITASSDIRTAMDAVNRAGVHRFFVEPVAVDDFRRQAAECVRSRRAERDLRERMARLREIESRSVPVRARVLLVDDDESILELFQAVLEDAGYDVTSEPTGHGALDQLGSGEYNLIVIDKNLPDISGMEVLRLARRLRPELEAVVVTGYASTESAIEAVEAGAYDYLRKPLEDIELLPRVVRRAIERQALSNERERLLHELIEANAALSKTNRELRRAQLSLKQKMDELVLFQDATVMSLARLAEYRDGNTGHHLERMRGYARILAGELVGSPGFEALNAAFVAAIFKTAPLHDIGKVAIPDRVLLKPGGLDAEEWKMMRTHPLIGGRTLEDAASRAGMNGPASLLRIGTNIAYFHHERWDGGGYPHGMKGDDIPMEARIVSVADAYDAITSRRCYKQPVSHATARSVLQHERGRQFDPRVIDAFLRREDDILRLKRRYAGDDVEVS